MNEQAQWLSQRVGWLVEEIREQVTGDSPREKAVALALLNGAVELVGELQEELGRVAVDVAGASRQRRRLGAGR
jgi:hypothetical protein